MKKTSENNESKNLLTDLEPIPSHTWYSLAQGLMALHLWPTPKVAPEGPIIKDIVTCRTSAAQGLNGWQIYQIIAPLLYFLIKLIEWYFGKICS